jgi:hypothetical protein
MRRFLILTLYFIFIFGCSAQKSTQYDSFGGYTAIKGKKTGWFHVQEINGRWFFVTPEGNAFFSLGATHAVETIKQDELSLFESRYEKSEEKLASFFMECFKDWGYNSSGYGPLPTMEKRIPYLASIWTEGPRSHSAGPKSVNSDIFDPVVQERLKETIRKGASNHKNNPNCMGYVFIDLAVWGVVPQGGISYVDFVRSLNPSAPGRLAYLGFLKDKYSNDIGLFNNAYSTTFSSFENMQASELSLIKPGNNQKIYADDEAFLNILAGKYFSIAVNELRKADPNHLILGDRFMATIEAQRGLRVPDSILKTASEYFDVIAFQPMGTQAMHKAYIDHVFSLTGKPVAFIDVNTIFSRPLEGQVDTEKYETEAGEHTLKYYTNAAESKYLIALHRCTVRDYRPWDTKFYRRGLLKADDTPYPILVDYTKRANRAVYEMVYGN